MLTTSYIISQVFVVIALLFLGSSYLVKDKRKVLFLGILCSTFYGLEYLLLGALTGLITNIISVVRNIWFYHNAKRKKKNSLFVFILLSIISIVFGVISFTHWYCILPIIATILFTYTIWQDDIKIYRYLAVPVSICWIVYNACYLSIMGVIAETIVLSFEIIGIIKYNKKKN
jgi:hypothetical protein